MSFRKWSITSLSAAIFVGTGVAGIAENRSITTLASPVTQQPTEVVRAVLANFERQNIAGIEQLLAEDSSFEVMFPLPGTNNIYQGREAVLGQIETVIGYFDRIEFVNERIYAAQDDRTVFVEARGNFSVRGTGASYRNTYIFVLEVDRGKVVAIREYANPLIVAELFNVPLTPSNSTPTR